MTAMLKSQRSLSDLSLLTRSQLRATPFCFRSFTPHWGTGRPIVDAGKLMVMRIHIDR